MRRAATASSANTFAGRTYPSTILGGVEELLHGGMWPLALLVFVASVCVPVLKLAGLAVLFGIYLVAAGVERFLVEFLRRNVHALGGLTGPQLESLVMIAVGLAGLAWLRRRAGGLGLRPVAAPAARTAR